jgi:hypothetical protein
MSRLGARAARRFVRSVQSLSLEIRIATSRRRSSRGRRPPGDPARTFKIVIWKLIGRLPHARSAILSCCLPKSIRPAARSTALSCAASRSVPELIRSTSINLNERLSLRRGFETLSSPQSCGLDAPTRWLPCVPRDWGHRSVQCGGPAPRMRRNSAVPAVAEAPSDRSDGSFSGGFLFTLKNKPAPAREGRGEAVLGSGVPLGGNGTDG